MKNILKITVFTLIVAALVMMTGCQKSQPEEAKGPIELGWYLGESDSHPWTIAAYGMADDIEERTGGAVTVKVYPNAVLGTQAEAIDMLRTGSLALLTSGPSILASFYEQVQVFSLPYAFDDLEQAYKYFDSDASQRIFNEIILEKSGVRTLDAWYFGDRNLTTNGIAVNSPEDLAGISVRSMDTPIAKTVIASLGGNPVPININELYLALQTGVVAGQENPVANIITQKFHEVQDHIVLTKHSVHLGTVHASEKIWETLTEEQQDTIMEIFVEYRPIIEEMIIEQTEKGLETLRESGVTIIEPELGAFSANAKKLVAETFADDAEWMKVINELEEFKANN